MVKKMKAFFIGASSDLGVHINGAHLGPKEILTTLKVPYQNFEQNNNYLKDLTNNKHKNEEEINKLNAQIYTYILKNIKKDKIPITIGGDHSIAIASALASASYYQDIGIVWVDAHGDYNTFKTTITGNIHGLPLASITNFEKELKPFTNTYINPKKTVIIGARALDKEELINLQKADVKVFTTKDVKTLGIEAIIQETLKIVGDKFHLSFDLDVIDPNQACGVSIPEENGLTVKEAEAINKALLKSQKVSAYDLVEYNPLKDRNEQTKKIALDLLKDVLEIIK